VIARTGATLTVIEYRPAAATTIAYALDGTRQVNRIASGRNEGATAYYVSAWKGDTLETRITSPVSPQSRDTIEYIERRHLAADGTLVSRTMIAGRPNSRTLVYVRAAR
jgi:hypothetical protein